MFECLKGSSAGREPLQQRDQGDDEDDEEEEDDDLDVMMSSPAVAGWTRAQKRVGLGVGAEREEVGSFFC